MGVTNHLLVGRTFVTWRYSVEIGTFCPQLHWETILKLHQPDFFQAKMNEWGLKSMKSTISRQPEISPSLPFPLFNIKRLHVFYTVQKQSFPHELGYDVWIPTKWQVRTKAQRRYMVSKPCIISVGETTKFKWATEKTLLLSIKLVVW